MIDSRNGEGGKNEDTEHLKKIHHRIEESEEILTSDVVGIDVVVLHVEFIFLLVFSMVGLDDLDAGEGFGKEGIHFGNGILLAEIVFSCLLGKDLRQKEDDRNETDEAEGIDSGFGEGDD